MPALQVYLYSMHGQQLAGQFSLGSEAAKEGVLDCIIYGDGLVALTGTARIPSKAKSPDLRVICLPRSIPEASQHAWQHASSGCTIHAMQFLASFQS